MSKNKKAETCLACNKAFTKTDSSIQCVICTLWIHHKPCSAVSDDGFKFLSEQMQATGTAYWACRSCVRYSQGITMRVREVEKKLEEVQKDIKDNAQEIQRVDRNVEDMRKELDKVKEQSKADGNNYITAEEYREREARRTNLILHRVKESAAMLVDERRQADLAECGNILREIGLAAEAVNIKLCRRIGEKGDEPRPLIVVLRSEASRAAILDSARYLRDTPYNEISIVPDLTYTQRQEEADLAEEAERKNREELTEEDQQKNLKWQVVGPRGAKKLVKTYARGWQNPPPRGRGVPRGGPRGARGSTRGLARPPLQPTVRMPAPNLLPPQPPQQQQPLLHQQQQQQARKRGRAEAAAAAAATEDDDQEGMEEEDEEETRSPASKR
jgi:hypothetical protein